MKTGKWTAKARRVVLTIEVDTVAQLTDIRRSRIITLEADGMRRTYLDCCHIEQIQANVIRSTKPKPAARKPAKRKGRRRG